MKRQVMRFCLLFHMVFLFSMFTADSSFEEQPSESDAEAEAFDDLATADAVHAQYLPDMAHGADTMSSIGVRLLFFISS